MKIQFTVAKSGDKSCFASTTPLHSLYNPKKEGEAFAKSVECAFLPKAIVLIEPALSYCAKSFALRFPATPIIAIRFSHEFDESNAFFSKVIYCKADNFFDKGTVSETKKSFEKSAGDKTFYNKSGAKNSKLEGANEINSLEASAFIESEILKAIGDDALLSTLFVPYPPTQKAFPTECANVWQAIKSALQRARSVLATKSHFQKLWLKNSIRLFCNIEKVCLIEQSSIRGGALKAGFRKVPLVTGDFAKRSAIKETVKAGFEKTLNIKDNLTGDKLANDKLEKRDFAKASFSKRDFEKAPFTEKSLGKDGFLKKELEKDDFLRKDLRKAKTLPIALCASGPSLEGSLKALCDNQNKLIIVALSSALLPLVSAGVLPDFVITTDAGYWARHHLFILAKYPSIKVALPPSAAFPFNAIKDYRALQKNRAQKLKMGEQLPTFILLNYNDDLCSKVQSLWEKDACAPSLKASANGTVSGTALELSLTLTGGDIFFFGLDLSEYGAQRSHCLPNALDAANYKKTNRLSTLETAHTRAFCNKESLKVYEKWFSTFEKGAPRFYRVASGWTFQNRFQAITDIDLKTFIEKLSLMDTSKKGVDKGDVGEGDVGKKGIDKNNANKNDTNANYADKTDNDVNNFDKKGIDKDDIGKKGIDKNNANENWIDKSNFSEGDTEKSIDKKDAGKSYTDKTNIDVKDFDKNNISKNDTRDGNVGKTDTGKKDTNYIDKNGIDKTAFFGAEKVVSNEAREKGLCAVESFILSASDKGNKEAFDEWLSQFFPLEHLKAQRISCPAEKERAFKALEKENKKFVEEVLKMIRSAKDNL